MNELWLTFWTGFVVTAAFGMKDAVFMLLDQIFDPVGDGDGIIITFCGAYIALFFYGAVHIIDSLYRLTNG